MPNDVTPLLVFRRNSAGTLLCSFLFDIKFYSLRSPQRCTRNEVEGMAAGLSSNAENLLLPRRPQRSRFLNQSIFTTIVGCCEAFRFWVGLVVLWRALSRPQIIVHCVRHPPSLHRQPHVPTDPITSTHCTVVFPAGISAVAAAIQRQHDNDNDDDVNDNERRRRRRQRTTNDNDDNKQTMTARRSTTSSKG